MLLILGLNTALAVPPAPGASAPPTSPAATTTAPATQPAATTPPAPAAGTPPPAASSAASTPAAPIVDEVAPGNKAWGKCAPHVKVQVAGKDTKEDKSDDKYVKVVRKLGKWTEAETTAAVACKIEIGGNETTFGSHTQIAWNGTNAACPTGLVLGPESGVCISSYNQKIEKDELASRGLGQIRKEMDEFEKNVGERFHDLEVSDAQQDAAIADLYERVDQKADKSVLAGKADKAELSGKADKDELEGVVYQSQIDEVTQRVDAVEGNLESLWTSFRSDSRPIGGPSVGYGFGKGVGGLTLGLGGGLDGKLFGFGGELFGGLHDQGSVIAGLDGQVYIRPVSWLRTGLIVGWQQTMLGIREADGQSEWEYSGALVGGKVSADLMPKRNGGLTIDLHLVDYVNIGFKGATKTEAPAYAQGTQHDLTGKVMVGWRFGGYTLR